MSDLSSDTIKSYFVNIQEEGSIAIFISFFIFEFIFRVITIIAKNTIIINKMGRMLIILEVSTPEPPDIVEKEKSESSAREFQAPCNSVADRVNNIPLPNRF